MSHSHDAGYWTRRHTESVVLDIGDDVGALVLYTPAMMHSREIEVSPFDDESTRLHTAVLERSFNGRTVFAAVYPELRAGTYRVWIDSEPTVTVSAGSVAELDASVVSASFTCLRRHCHPERSELASGVEGSASRDAAPKEADPSLRSEAVNESEQP